MQYIAISMQYWWDALWQHNKIGAEYMNGPQETLGNYTL